MTYLLALLFSLSLHAAPLEIQEAWSGISDPILMSKNFETRLYLLPPKGEVSHQQRFWSGDYWAMYKGNINFNWYADRGFNISSPTLEQLKTMSADEISQLSPAEKFDILNGRYYYPLKAEVEKLTDYDAKKWEGICHGWAPASMNHNEPTPKTVKNQDGILIPFGSADIKAILSYFYAFPYQVNDTHQIGRRCDHSVLNSEEDCKQDLNAGAFHIILTNKIGLQNEGFVADMDRFKQVWNHPIKAYTSRVMKEGGATHGSAPGTTRTVKFSTTVTYADESINSWDPLIGTKNQRLKTQEMNYIVELNANGEIIGGQWTSLFRPDFLWLKEKPAKFTGNYLRLTDLLND